MPIHFIDPKKRDAFRAIVFNKAATNQEKREAWLAFAPAWERPAIIEAERAGSATPALLFLLKHDPKLKDLLVPDDEEDPDGVFATEPMPCEECGRACDGPKKRWCSDCASRVFYGLPNHDPEVE
jgi:hypothetical protein